MVTVSTRRGHGEEIEKAKSILATEQEKRSEWSKPTLHHQHPDGLTLTPLHCLNSLHSSFHPRSHHSHRPRTMSFRTLQERRQEDQTAAEVVAREVGGDPPSSTLA